MRINHNVSAMITQGSLFKVNREMGKSIQKLSTGLRINTAADDAAGLGVSENLRTQVRGMGQALKNTQDAIALLNIADGALQEQTAIIQRMRELVLQARNDTYTSIERNYMGTEFSQLVRELDRIAAATNYNGMGLFAAPEQTTGDDAQNYYSMAEVRTVSDFPPHRMVRGQNVWDNPGDYIFGANDLTSAHHFNMMIGANFTAQDAAAYNNDRPIGDNYRYSFDKNAENLITIQFGQMDSNALLSVYADSLFDDAKKFFDGFDYNPTGDAEDGWFNLASQIIRGRDATQQDKLGFILKTLDGDLSTEQDLLDGIGVTTDIESVTGLKRLNTMRAYIGSMTNRLEATINNLQQGISNTQSAESVVRDLDFAQETTNMTKNSILTRSATSMLAQANVTPQSVLKLLR